MPVFSKGVKVVNNQVIFALAFVKRLLNGNKRSLFSLQQSHWIYIEYNKNFRLQIYLRVVGKTLRQIAKLSDFIQY